MAEIAQTDTRTQTLFQHADSLEGAIVPDRGQTHLSVLDTVIEGWKAVRPLEEVTVDFRESVIEQYRKYHNLENGDTGAKLGHNTLTDGIYSRDNLPAVAAIDEWARNSGDVQAQESAAIALFTLHAAIETLEQFTSQNGFNTRGAFARMRSEMLSGDQSWPTFLGLMGIARGAAAECIRGHANKLPPDTLITVGHEKDATFGETAFRALREYQESERGVDLGPEFTRRLLDPHTRALVISLDINSTLNAGESYATLPLLDSATAELQTLADHYRKIFPEKELFIVLNTGRPALYAWGISDLLPPLPEARKIGLAESGGVILSFEGSQLLKEVAVESPQLWQEQLDGIRTRILSQVTDRHNVIIEPKDSMLSIRIANRPERGGNFLYTTKGGAEVTDQWIQTQVDRYLTETYESLSTRMVTIVEKIREMPEANNVIAQALDQAGDTSETTARPAVLKALKEAFADAQQYRVTELQELHEAMKTIELMQIRLEAKFNATAGYVDIGHRDLNKYSTLLRAVKQHGYDAHEVLTIHVGDSSTDIMPTDQTGPGEVNDGANEVFLVSVENSSKSLRQATQQRSEHGIQTSRGSVSAVRDVIRHIVSVVDAEGHRIKQQG